MAPGETFRHKYTGFVVESLHQLDAIAGEEVKLAAFAADHSDGHLGVAHRNLDFAKRVRRFHGWMFRQKFQRISRKEGIPTRFVSGSRDEKISQQSLVDPCFDGF